jgi:hypothetical protein
MNNILSNILNIVAVTIASFIKQFPIAFFCIGEWHHIKAKSSLRHDYAALQEGIEMREK